MAKQNDDTTIFYGSPIQINELARMYEDPSAVRNFLFDCHVDGTLQGVTYGEIHPLIERNLRMKRRPSAEG
mgnify:CR=1 FL=1